MSDEEQREPQGWGWTTDPLSETWHVEKTLDATINEAAEVALTEKRSSVWIAPAYLVSATQLYSPGDTEHLLEILDDRAGDEFGLEESLYRTPGCSEIEAEEWQQLIRELHAAIVPHLDRFTKDLMWWHTMGEAEEMRLQRGRIADIVTGVTAGDWLRQEHGWFRITDIAHNTTTGETRIGLSSRIVYTPPGDTTLVLLTRAGDEIRALPADGEADAFYTGLMRGIQSRSCATNSWTRRYFRSLTHYKTAFAKGWYLGRLFDFLQWSHPFLR